MFERENRYLIFKLTDVDSYLTGEEIDALYRLDLKIDVQRRLHGKEGLHCVVVEHDWPEYEPTWKAIEDRCGGINAE